MMQSHLPGYLKLTRKVNDSPIILFRENENGNINLDPKEIGIIKTRISGSSKTTLAFDSDNNYKFMRYEILEKNSDYSELKKVVDKKLSDLEEKLRRNN